MSKVWYKLDARKRTSTVTEYDTVGWNPATNMILSRGRVTHWMPAKELQLWHLLALWPKMIQWCNGAMQYEYVWPNMILWCDTMCCDPIWYYDTLCDPTWYNPDLLQLLTPSFCSGTWSDNWRWTCATLPTFVQIVQIHILHRYCTETTNDLS